MLFRSERDEEQEEGERDEEQEEGERDEEQEEGERDEEQERRRERSSKRVKGQVSELGLSLCSRSHSAPGSVSTATRIPTSGQRQVRASVMVKDATVTGRKSSILG